MIGGLCPTIEVIGFAAGGLAALARVLAKHWLPLGWSKKAPIGCPTCMGGWATIALLVVLVPLGLVPTGPINLILEGLGSLGIAAWINGQIVPVPLDLPKLD